MSGNLEALRNEAWALVGKNRRDIMRIADADLRQGVTDRDEMIIKQVLCVFLGTLLMAPEVETPKPERN